MKLHRIHFKAMLGILLLPCFFWNKGSSYSPLFMGILSTTISCKIIGVSKKNRKSEILLQKLMGTEWEIEILGCQKKNTPHWSRKGEAEKKCTWQFCEENVTFKRGPVNSRDPFWSCFNVTVTNVWGSFIWSRCKQITWDELGDSELGNHHFQVPFVKLCLIFTPWN